MLPADAKRSGAARLLLPLSLQPPSWELPPISGSSPPIRLPRGVSPLASTQGDPTISSGSTQGKTSQHGRCHQAIRLQRKKLFHPSRETCSREPPAKCLYQGAGEEGGGSGSPSLEWGMCLNVFSALRPAEREKSLLQHELLQFIIISAYLRIRRPDPTGGTGHPVRGLRGFHLQSQRG